MTAAEKLIEIAQAEVGYLEKATNSCLDDKTANAGSNNYTKYARDLFPALQGQPWCDMFVDWCFVQAYGLGKAKALLCGGLEAYTPTSAQYYKSKGQYHISDPLPGDQIFFKNSIRICHTGIVTKVTSDKVYTIEGNTSGGSGVIANGGAVCQKSYALTSSRIDGYGRPDWSLAEICDEGWRRAADGIRWWYEYTDGSYPANQWRLIHNHWYLFDREGYMCTGWHRWNGSQTDPEDGSGDWYYLDDTADGPLEGACWHTRDNGAQEIWWVDQPD